MAIILQTEGPTLNFLGSVNRILRINNIIKGDDDEIINFSENQHAAKIELAQIVIQDEINGLLADRIIPYEKTTGSLTTSDGVRTYTLASDFVRFFGKKPYFYYSEDNQQVFEYEGGEDALRLSIPNYKDQTGNPINWYPDLTTTKKIGLYQTPNTEHANRVYTYDYEKNVSLLVEEDIMPFHSENEAQIFAAMAARRFRYMEENTDIVQLDNDPIWNGNRSTLFNLMRFSNKKTRWGVKHG